MPSLLPTAPFERAIELGLEIYLELVKSATPEQRQALVAIILEDMKAWREFFQGARDLFTLPKKS